MECVPTCLPVKPRPFILSTVFPRCLNIFLSVTQCLVFHTIILFTGLFVEDLGNSNIRYTFCAQIITGLIFSQNAAEKPLYISGGSSGIRMLLIRFPSILISDSIYISS